jgi:Ca2+-binding EF-hand superfamily protein
MDENKDGLISKEELFSLFQSVGNDVSEEAIEKMIKDGDENFDGQL